MPVPRVGLGSARDRGIYGGRRGLRTHRQGCRCHGWVWDLPGTEESMVGGAGSALTGRDAGATGGFGICPGQRNLWWEVLAPHSPAGMPVPRAAWVCAGERIDGGRRAVEL